MKEIHVPFYFKTLVIWYPCRSFILFFNVALFLQCISKHINLNPTASSVCAKVPLCVCEAMNCGLSAFNTLLSSGWHGGVPQHGEPLIHTFSKDQMFGHLLIRCVFFIFGLKLAFKQMWP